MSIKKLRRLLFFLILIIIIYLIVYYVPKNYKYEYKINGYFIAEKYNNKDKIYTFKIKKGNKVYETISENKYTPKRKYINEIKEYKNDETSCIVINSDIIDNNILCLNNGELIDYHLVENILPKKYYTNIKKNQKKYKDIISNILDNKTYFVWNYTKFSKINKNKQEQISIFNNDIYNLELVVLIDKYLIMADYDQKYNFNKFIRLNLETNKIEEINSNYDISFDSRIIGTYKNSLYLIDKKNKKEYEINTKKKTVEVVSKNGIGKIYKNEEWKKVKINKIITDELKFEYSNNYNYVIENNILYLYQKNTSKKIKISNKNIKNIVYTNSDEVYYIVDDKLYKYDFNYGEQEILEYFELNFNYNNMIFIY